MSLSSLLLAKTKAVDTELDALFKASSIPAVTSKSTQSTVDVKKRKLHSEEDVQDEGAPVLPRKKAKSVEVKSVKFASTTKTEMKETKALAKEAKVKVKATKVKGKGKGKAKEVNEDEDEDDEEDNNSDLENVYLKSKAAKTKQAARPEAAAEKEDTDEEEDSEEEGEPTQIVHESIQPKPAKKQKFVPADETPEQRDRRTIFIGNLPSEVAHKRPLRKQLEHHITALVPTSKIESVRFRSVAFQAPTAKLPTDADGPSSSTTSTKTKTPRPHVQDRTATWRSKVDEKDDEFVKQDDKKFLTSSQKKRIAFINQEFHSSADGVNAYVVFAHPVEVKDRPANLPPPKEVMDPYEAAKAAVEKCDGTVFMERMIRVDAVGREAVETRKEGKDGVGDPKLAVFVGNLDFASKEEDLRVFFEGVVSAERGPPPLKEDEDEEGMKKPNTWVTRVRIVRDKETQLGKGFAYIQFADRECVDEVLALEEQKLKFAKRKLRVQRCKSLPGAKVAVDAKTHPKAAANAPRSAPVPIVIPKGDPALGERLAHLSKDARKQAKSSDADRVARRLAKKKARMAIGPPGGSGVKGKDRERVRKAAGGSGSAKAKNLGRKEGKGRVRSEKSLLKRNLKK